MRNLDTTQSYTESNSSTQSNRLGHHHHLRQDLLLANLKLTGPKLTEISLHLPHEFGTSVLVSSIENTHPRLVVGYVCMCACMRACVCVCACLALANCHKVSSEATGDGEIDPPTMGYRCSPSRDSCTGG